MGKHSFVILFLSGTLFFEVNNFAWFSYGMMKSPNLERFMGNSDFHISISPCKKVPSLKRSINGWNSRFVFGWPIFRCYVSFRECTILNSKKSKNKPKSTKTQFLMVVLGPRWLTNSFAVGLLQDQCAVFFGVKLSYISYKLPSDPLISQ